MNNMYQKICEELTLRKHGLKTGDDVYYVNDLVIIKSTIKSVKSVVANYYYPIVQFIDGNQRQACNVFKTKLDATQHLIKKIKSDINYDIKQILEYEKTLQKYKNARLNLELKLKQVEKLPY